MFYTAKLLFCPVVVTVFTVTIVVTVFTVTVVVTVFTVTVVVTVFTVTVVSQFSAAFREIRIDFGCGRELGLCVRAFFV